MSALKKLLARVTKVVVKLGLVEVTFERDTLKELFQNQAFVHSLLSDLFLDRRVMWMDFTREKPEWVIKSLEEMVTRIDQAVARISAPAASEDADLSGLLHRWRDACVRARQATQDRLDEMKENNRTAFHQDEFIDPTDFLPKILVVFRKETLPFVSALLQLLPEDDPYRAEVQKKWYEARRMLDEADKDLVIANWEEA